MPCGITVVYAGWRSKTTTNKKNMKNYTMQTETIRGKRNFKTTTINTQNIQITPHASKRAAQRGISESMITAAICYGECIYKQGLRYFICLEKNIRGIYPPASIGHYKNTVVILSFDNSIVTCYKNKDAFSHIRKKYKRLLTRNN